MPAEIKQKPLCGSKEKMRGGRAIILILFGGKKREKIRAETP